MRKILASLLLAVSFIVIPSATLFAEDKSYSNWNEVVDDMDKVLAKANKLYASGDAVAAKKQVNVAYYQFYEKIGFERTTQARISGSRAGQVELQFSKCKKVINAGVSAKEVKAELDTLSAMLREDAKKLDPKSGMAEFWANFIASLLIILREGFEAILIVGAIIAYLVKSGNEDKLGAVYKGSILGIVASVVMAAILICLTRFGFDSGQGQEVVEGVTMFIAVLVLFYTSNWMLSKASSKAWSNYIQGKIQTSVDKRSMFSLAFTCFLAVFREGAEVILFYQALFAGATTGGAVSAILIGLAVGAVLLVFVYLAIRFAGLKLPLKPFFLATSILMFVMCVSFVGNGISEFVDADLLSPTIVNHVPTISILGLHPYLESLVGQGIMIVIILGTLGIAYLIQNKKKDVQEA